LESGDIDLSILNLSARWRWVVRSTPRPLYPMASSSLYSHRRLWGFQSRSGRGDKEKISYHCQDSNPSRL